LITGQKGVEVFRVPLFLQSSVHFGFLRRAAAPPAEVRRRRQRADNGALVGGSRKAE
jgi:hypothetical protein